MDIVLTGSDNMWTVKIYIFYFKSTNCMEQYPRVLLLVLTNIHLDILKSPGMNLPTTIFNYLYVQIIGLSRSWISSWIIFIVLDFLHSPEFFWLFVKIFFFKQKTAYEIGVRLVGSEMCIRDRDILKSPGMNLPTTIFNYLYVQIIDLSRSWISSWIIFIVLDFLHSPEFFWLFVKIFFFILYFSA